MRGRTWQISQQPAVRVPLALFVLPPANTASTLGLCLGVGNVACCSSDLSTALALGFRG